mmetsp:Transcript_2469/g.5209  ORF Transcript_2469/g.5209 Transcript_2469/m.5209 type:complete len:147 (-) Transcript_2469:477-917(-)
MIRQQTLVHHHSRTDTCSSKVCKTNFWKVTCPPLGVSLRNALRRFGEEVSECPTALDDPHTLWKSTTWSHNGLDFLCNALLISFSDSSCVLLRTQAIAHDKLTPVVATTCTSGSPSFDSSVDFLFFADSRDNAVGVTEEGSTLLFT